MSSQAAEIRSLLLLIVRALIDDPSQLTVDVTEANGSIDLQLRVTHDDLGKIIGKQGRTARSLRTVLIGAAMKSGVRCRLDILE